MHDFNCVSASEMYYPLLSERTKYLKETPEGVSMMCKAMEEMRNEAEARGEARGKANAIIQLGRMKNLSDDQIMDDLIAVCKITKENARKLLGIQTA